MIALVDCNNFFASCEEVFNPKLARKALAILSRNDGMVIARSQKAKELGIKMGEAAFLYKGRKDIEFLSSNFTLYADMSHRVMRTLETFSPHVEIYSVDEAFLLLDGELSKQAEEIRSKLKKWTGISTSLGVAPTKTLAKLASEEAKKTGANIALLTTNGEIEAKLKKISPQEIWGIGPHLAQRLKQRGIHTAWQLREMDDHSIRKFLGLTGFQTVLELRQTPCFRFHDGPEKKKSIVCSRSFSQKIEELSILEEAVASFASHAAEKLRKQKSLASFLSVFIATSPYQEPYLSPSFHHHFSSPTSYTPALIEAAKQGLQKIFQKGHGYKRAGVLLAEFTDQEACQTDLFAPDPSSEKKIRAVEMMDQINGTYRKQVVRFAAAGIERRWKSVSAHVSPHFTTNWSELLSVR